MPRLRSAAVSAVQRGAASRRTTSRARSVGTRLLAAALLLASTVGCRSAAAPSPAPDESALAVSASAEPLIGRSFGDSAEYDARIVTLDTAQERVTVRLGKPAFVLVLQVEPGRSVDLLTPSVKATPVRWSKGERAVSVFFADPSALNASARSYSDCVANGRAATTRTTTAPRTTATARPATTGSATDKNVRRDEVAVTNGRALGQLESNCRMQADMLARALSKRAEGERYVLVLATNVAPSPLHVIVRLESLSVIASDVHSTMEAIAEGLFADKKQTWSGYYIAR